MLLSNLAAPGNGRRVLDVGCGNGYLGRILAERGYDVTGIEQRGGTDANFPAAVKLVEADLEAGLPALDGKFDYVICADILEHLRNPQRLLRQIGQVMAANGQLIASLPNSGNVYFRLVVLSGRFPQEDKGLFDRTHVRFFTWDGWRALLQSSGFRLENWESSCLPFSVTFPGAGDTFPIRALEWISYMLAKIWKTLFAYQFIVKARVQ